jgi:hypothetical protein
MHNAEAVDEAPNTKLQAPEKLQEPSSKEMSAIRWAMT